MISTRHILCRLLTRFFFVLVLELAIAAPLWSSTRIDLNDGWRFRTDRDEKGESSGWMRELPAETEQVRVPHTWNVGKYDDYEGVAWYFRTICLSSISNGSHIELHFDATFYRSRIWLNGTLLGQHEGGHTPYWFDLSQHLKEGNNFLAVELDNRPTRESIPGLALRLRDGGHVWYDWWHYGGLVRSVWLSMNKEGLIRRQRITSKIGSASGRVSAQVFIENVSKQNQTFVLKPRIVAPSGEAIPVPAVRVSVKPASRATAEVSTTVEHPELWGIDHPAIYELVTDLADAHGRLVDTHKDSFGLRTIEIRDRHLLVNGERVRLTGITRHEDSPWEGLAETAGTIKNDYDALSELHVTLTRPVHYPQNELILDYADRHGILLISEIPMWQFTAEQMSDPKVIGLAKQMMREMIEADENHPSIFAWSVCNESEATKKGGRAYIDLMRDWIHQLDPGRYVTYADNDIAWGPDPASEAANDVDFIMMNAYFGTWSGRDEDLGPRLEQIGRDYPNKMLIISEFGYPAFFAGNSPDGDKQRSRLIETQLDTMQKYDFVAGAIFWCYQDYKSHLNLWPGLQEGYVDIGLVDEHRQRRPSFFVWQKRNEPVIFGPVTWDFDRQGRSTGFRISLTMRGGDQLPSYPMTNVREKWELRDRDGLLLATGDQVLTDSAGPQLTRGEWPARKMSEATELRVQIVSGEGSARAHDDMVYHTAAAGGQSIDEMRQTHPE